MYQLDFFQADMALDDNGELFECLIVMFAGHLVRERYTETVTFMVYFHCCKYRMTPVDAYHDGVDNQCLYISSDAQNLKLTITTSQYQMLQIVYISVYVLLDSARFS